MTRAHDEGKPSNSYHDVALSKGLFRDIGCNIYLYNYLNDSIQEIDRILNVKQLFEVELDEYNLLCSVEWYGQIPDHLTHVCEQFEASNFQNRNPENSSSITYVNSYRNLFQT